MTLNVQRIEGLVAGTLFEHERRLPGLLSTHEKLVERGAVWHGRRGEAWTGRHLAAIVSGCGSAETKRVTSCVGRRAADDRIARSPVLAEAQHRKRRWAPQHQRRRHTQRRRHHTQWHWVGWRLAEVLISLKHSSPSRRIRALSLGCSPLRVLRWLKKRRVQRKVVVALPRAAEPSVEAGVPGRTMTRGHGRQTAAMDMRKRGEGGGGGVVPLYCCCG